MYGKQNQPYLEDESEYRKFCRIVGELCRRLCARMK